MWHASWFVMTFEGVDLATRVKWIKLVLDKVDSVPHANR